MASTLRRTMNAIGSITAQIAPSGDPREILDLVDTVGLSPEHATDRLTAALRGALIGWAGQRA